MFGTSLSFLPTLMSENVVGKATGLLSLCTGLLSFINIPLNSLAADKHDGNFFIPNLIHTLFLIPCFVAAFALRKVISDETRAETQPLIQAPAGQTFTTTRRRSSFLFYEARGIDVQRIHL